MAVASGKNAAINGVSSVRSWSATSLIEPKRFISSANDAMEGHLGGRKDVTGSYSAYGYSPPQMPGDSFSFSGYTGVDLWSGTALVESVSITCAIESADPLSYEVNFAANSAWSIGAVGTEADATVPAAYSPIGCKVEFSSSDTPTFVEISDVREWKLDLKCVLNDYASSSTFDSKRRVASNMSASGSVTVYESSAANLLTVGTVGQLRMYVTGSAFWLAKWMMVTNVAPAYDVEGGDIIGATYQFVYTGFKRISGTMTKGAITKPDTTNWWN